MKTILIIGHLGRDPEMRYTPSGQSVTSFSVAASGYDKDKTEWFNCSAWGRLAEVTNQYLSKGSHVYIEGELSVRPYEANDGTPRYSLDVNVKDVQFLGGKGQGEVYDDAIVGSDDYEGTLI